MTNIFFLGLATSQRTHQVPWKRLKVDTSKYIASEHLPRPDFVLLAPKGMKWDPLCEFFSHIAEREKTFENADIFHFQHVEEGRKERRSDRDDGTIDESGAGPDHGTSANGAGHPDGANAGGGEEGGTTRGGEATRVSEGGDGATAAAAAALPNAKPAKKKGTKKTKASTTKKKKVQKTPNQPTTPRPPEDTSGAEEPAPPLPKPRPKPRPKARPSARPVTDSTQAHEELTTNAPSTSIPTAGNAETPAPVLPKPRPRPRPKVRPMAPPVTDTTQGHEELTTNVPSTSIPPTGDAEGPGTEDQLTPPPTKQAPDRVPDAAIDPLILAASNQPSRATSDNLALQEAGRFAVKGKRVPKKKQQF